MEGAVDVVGTVVGSRFDLVVLDYRSVGGRRIGYLV